MSQLKELTFITQAGGSQTVTLQNYRNQDAIESWSDPDKAISGKLRQNLRGTRGQYRLSYSHSTEASVFRNLLTNIATDLLGNEDSIILEEDGQQRIVVPTDNFMQQLEYSNTISNYKPVLEFYDVGLGRSAGTYVETGYVTQGYVE